MRALNLFLRGRIGKDEVKLLKLLMFFLGSLRVSVKFSVSFTKVNCHLDCEPFVMNCSNHLVVFQVHESQILVFVIKIILSPEVSCSQKDIGTDATSELIFMISIL